MTRSEQVSVYCSRTPFRGKQRTVPYKNVRMTIFVWFSLGLLLGGIYSLYN